MNWNDPTERMQLVERVGTAEYNRLFRLHILASTVETVNGYAIRPVTSARFGRVFMVDGLARGAATLEGARAIALAAPVRP